MADFAEQVRLSGISDSIFDRLFVDLVRLMQPAQRALDIGPGRGKYGRLMREAGAACRIEAMEISPQYVEAFGLRGIYDDVRIQDAATLCDSPAWFNERWDLVVIGDCIEHLPKSRGLDLLNFLTYRCGYIVLVVPEFVYYDTAGMQHAESHISVWSEEDFRWHDRWAFMRSEYMQFFVLRGYQKAAIGLEDLVGRSNAQPSDILRPNGAVLKQSLLQTCLRVHPEIVGDVAYTYREP